MRADSGREPCLSLTNAGVAYGLHTGKFRKKLKNFWALKDVTLKLYHGETLGILGANGAGKSTLMRVLGGIIEIDKGTFTKEENLHVQLLSLGLGFEAPLTGRDNAILSGMLLGKTREYMEKRIDRITEFSELGEFIDQPIYTYSSGMLIRLGFSVAIEAECDVLLIDEVMSVGDVHFQEKSGVAIREMLDGYKTIVLISHSPEEIRRVCDRAVWIDHGVTMAEGNVEEVIRKYERHSGVKPSQSFESDKTRHKKYMSH